MKKKPEEQLSFEFDENFEKPQSMKNNETQKKQKTINPDDNFDFITMGNSLREQQEKFDSGDPNAVDVKSKIQGLRDIIKKRKP